MNTAQIIFFIIKMLVEQGLPALNAITEMVHKWNGVENIPLDEWETMFDKHIKGYWDIVDEPPHDPPPAS